MNIIQQNVWVVRSWKKNSIYKKYIFNWFDIDRILIPFTQAYEYLEDEFTCVDCGRGRWPDGNMTGCYDIQVSMWYTGIDLIFRYCIIIHAGILLMYMYFYYIHVLIQCTGIAMIYRYLYDIQILLGYTRVDVIHRYCIKVL